MSAMSMAEPVIRTNVEFPTINLDEAHRLNVLRSRTPFYGFIRTIQDKHREVARLCASGLNDTEVSEITGFSAGHVGRIRNTDLIQEHIVALREERDGKLMAARAKLEEAAERVAQYMVDVVDDPTASTKYRLQAAESVLDRVGVSKVTRSENTVVSKHTTIENIRRIASATAPNDNIPTIDALFESSAPTEAQPSEPLDDQQELPF